MADDPRLAEACFFVEANDFERLCLYRDHSDIEHGYQRWEPPERDGPRVKWEQDNFGFWMQIGEVGDWPVNVCFHFVRINGLLVAFYEGISRVVDSVMIEEWLRVHYTPKYDKGHRLAYTNAMNFHLCLHHCIEKGNKP